MVEAMVMALYLEPNGRLKLLESDVEKHRRQFLEANGWRVIETRAESRMPNGRRTFGKGTADWIAVKSHYSPAGRKRCAQEGCSVIVIENKRALARTEKNHKLRQAANQFDWERAGFSVWRDRDGDADPIKSFQDWFQERFG